MQRGLVAEPSRRRPQSPRRAAVSRRLASAVGARRRTWMAEIPLLVHGAGLERDGQRRREDGVEACGNRARTSGEPCSAIGAVRAAPARVGCSDAEPYLTLRYQRSSGAAGPIRLHRRRCYTRADGHDQPPHRRFDRGRLRRLHHRRADQPLVEAAEVSVVPREHAEDDRRGCRAARERLPRMGAFGLTTNVQYWRSLEQLMAYSRARDQTHYPNWVKF